MQLEFLTDDEQHIRICKDYWQMNEDGKFALQVKDIALLHDMPRLLISKLVKQYAYAWSAKDCCHKCKKPVKYRLRKDLQERQKHYWIGCNDCIEIERIVVEVKKKHVLLAFRDASEDVISEPLDLKTKIYLLASIKALGGEDIGVIEPLNIYPPFSLSPTFKYDLDIIKHLHSKNLLLLKLNTNLDSIELNEAGDIAFLHIAMFSFDLASDYKNVLDLSAAFFDFLLLKNVKESRCFTELCREVMLSECIGFLEHTIDRYELYFSPGEKTKKILNQCLESFSVAQVYNFIWRAVRDAAAYYMRCSISKTQAANTIVGRITQSLKQALADKWEVKPFTRNYNIPQSQLSKMIFNTILGTDDGGFNIPLHALIKQNGLSPYR